MGEFLDLDKLLPPSKEVRIKGQTYRISASLTVKETLEILQKREAMEKAGESEELYRELVAQAARLFREHHPELTVDDLAEMLTMQQLSRLVEFAFSDEDTSSQSEDGNPTLDPSQPAGRGVDADPTVPPSGRT